MPLAAKHFDVIVGLDVHIVQPPGTVPPVPIPHPFVGIVLDPFDYLPLIGSTVTVNARKGPVAVVREAPAGLITWISDPQTLAPCSKIVGERAYSVVCDHLGTPVLMLDESGKVVWDAEVSIWGEVRVLVGRGQDMPFRFLGQVEDWETGLYYNRYREFDPQAGGYLSVDPIGLAGGINAFAYVGDPLVEVDPLGLARHTVRVQIQKGAANLASIAVMDDVPITVVRVERAMLETIEVLAEDNGQLVPKAHGAAAQLSIKMREIAASGGISQGGNILREWLHDTGVRFDVENRGLNLTKCK